MTREVFGQVRDDSSSLRCLVDKDSLYSGRTVTTRTSSFISVRFGFDQELFKTRVYQEAVRSIIRWSVRDEKRFGNITEAPDMSRHIRESLKRERMISSNKIQVLLIGSSSSGKTALVEQLAPKYSYEQRVSCRWAILNDILQSIRTVLNQIQVQEPAFEDVEISHHAQTVVRSVLHEGRGLPPEITSAIKALWSKSTIRELLYKSDGDHLKHNRT